MNNTQKDTGLWNIYSDSNPTEIISKPEEALPNYLLEEGKRIDSTEVSIFQGFETGVGTLSPENIPGFYSSVPEHSAPMLLGLGASALLQLRKKERPKNKFLKATGLALLLAAASTGCSKEKEPSEMARYLALPRTDYTVKAGDTLDQLTEGWSDGFKARTRRNGMVYLNPGKFPNGDYTPVVGQTYKVPCGKDSE